MSWWVFWDAEPLKLALKYFPYPNIFFIKPDSRDLIDNLILTFLHRLHYPKLPLLWILRYHYCWHLVSLHFYPPTPSWWCFTLAVTQRKHYELSISQIVLACMLAIQENGVLEIVQKTPFLNSGFICSYFICYLIIFYH